MMHEINEDQVVEYIEYNIHQTMEQYGIPVEEAIESVRYYFDLLFNSVIAQMENSQRGKYENTYCNISKCEL